ERALDEHVTARQVTVAPLDHLDRCRLGVYKTNTSCQVLVAHLSLLWLDRGGQPTMKGSTDFRTVATSAGLPKAPSGVIDIPSSVFRVAAWRASTLWIESAAASTSGLSMFPAWPR